MSSVLVPKLTPVINSLEDLPMSSLNIIVYKGTSVETMIKVVKLELTNQIIRNNRLRSNFPGNRRERQHILAAKTKTQRKSRISDRLGVRNSEFGCKS